MRAYLTIFICYLIHFHKRNYNLEKKKSRFRVVTKTTDCFVIRSYLAKVLVAAQGWHHW